VCDDGRPAGLIDKWPSSSRGAGESEQLASELDAERPAAGRGACTRAARSARSAQQQQVATRPGAQLAAAASQVPAAQRSAAARRGRCGAQIEAPIV
jgi:hypothetical protein